MNNKISRRSFLKAAALSTLGVAALGTTAIAEQNENKAGLVPVFDGYGSKYEYGHFTVEATVIDANSEPFNKNASFSVYHIMDYTKEMPYADSMDTNGATEGNNTASMYVITSADEALLVDMGNGAMATAFHFGEDYEDPAVLKKIDQEYRELVLGLAGDRKLSVAITHKHGDHVGFSTAFENSGLTVYYPEQDLTEDIQKRFAAYDFKTFTAGEFSIPVGDIALDTIVCAGHTDGSTIYVINTPVITYNYGATNASATYISLIGDAIGSGSSVWIFSLDGLKSLDSSIDAAVEKMESYTAFDAHLGKGEETGAKMLMLGGHGWQYDNAFGRMNMDIQYAKSMQNLIHELSDSSKWEYDGVDGLHFTDWMRKGKIALKECNRGRYTAYFGTTLTSAAAITCPLEAMRQFAGQIPVEEEE